MSILLCLRVDTIGIEISLAGLFCSIRNSTLFFDDKNALCLQEKITTCIFNQSATKNVKYRALLKLDYSLLYYMLIYGLLSLYV